MISVVTDEVGVVVSEVENHGGSNNLAELIAVEHALEYAIGKGAKEVHIITDSQNNLRWIKRNDAELKAQKCIRKMNDGEWYQAIKNRITLMQHEIKATFEWCPREDNVAGHYIEEKTGL
jgi:ribonuclease HI